MQKLTALLVALFSLALCSNRVFAQYAFPDAQTIWKDAANWNFAGGLITVTSTQTYLKLVRSYLPAGNLSDDNIVKAFQDNPFLRLSAVHNIVPTDLKPLTLSTDNISGLDVTNIANGLSALLIDRAKQELTIAFFNRFKAFANKHKEFGLLFPATTNNLEKLLTFSYPQVLPILRNGFFSDLRALPVNLPGLLNIDPYKQFFDKYPELRITVSALSLISEVQSGASTPPQALNEFAADNNWPQEGATQLMKNLHATIQIAALVSQSLRNSDSKKIWVAPSDFKILATTPALSTIYFGLLWQQANTNKITFYPDVNHPDQAVTLTSLLQQRVQPLVGRLTQFVALADQVGDAFHTIQTNKTGGKANTNTDYYNYISATIDAIDTAFGIVDLFSPSLNAKPYLALARTGNAIYKDVYSQQYTQGVSDALDFLGQIGALAKGYTQATQADAKAKANAIETLTEFVQKVKPYILFMANVAEASSATDVQAALNNAILPVGSSAVKKNTHFNIAVQAYLGAYAVTGHTGSNVTGIWADKFGVIAPIGFSITPGFLSQGKYGSLSLFLEAFDLGAIVDYQLKTDTVANGSGTPTTAVSKSYSVQLGQILSPGVYVEYGAPANLPLALGFGGQYGPGLSKINATGQATVSNPSWRWNFTLTVDLPLFNIWNITKTTQPK
jgi:hypothetical protein